MSANPDRPPLDRWRADALLDPERKLWGLPLIAEALGVSIDTARTWAKMDGVPIYRPAGTGSYFAFRTELLAWLRTKPGNENQ
ncbi:DNA-binding protein [Paracoccus yeei]|uniref:DNA-binding protein n=1 Tax=Paracoccus yeei TaxID=147645 RepID=A0A2D2BYL8_9RHOB|nr:DNA-binding protein [Paracoccus yeei]ATQ55334.1 DNA-binding protein [Paracoccus yeei]AYF02642.1 DNA-binding protein [Paracoccus yeei]